MANGLNETAPAAQAATGSGDGVDVSSTGRYLTFTLQGEIYALDINRITEIIEYRSLTVVPMMPAFIRGVINLRGRVLPVVDLAARFGRSETVVARRTGILVVETANATAAAAIAGQGIGILVDAVNKVVHLNAGEIAPPPAFGSGIRTDYITGMAKIDGEFVIVLDIDRVLTQAEGNHGAATEAVGAST